MISVAVERDREVADLIDSTRMLFAAETLSRGTLSIILARLEKLAARNEFWAASEYADAAPGEEGPLYLISEQPDHSLALYLNILTPGMKYPPHNHTTWACVASVMGAERNYLFDRMDDRSVPGRADIRPKETVDIVPGRAIALMPDDIHAIENASQETTRHLHFYGRALEVLTERMTFEADSGTCRLMPLLSATEQS